MQHVPNPRAPSKNRTTFDETRAGSLFAAASEIEPRHMVAIDIAVNTLGPDRAAFEFSPQDATASGPLRASHPDEREAAAPRHSGRQGPASPPMSGSCSTSSSERFTPRLAYWSLSGRDYVRTRRMRFRCWQWRGRLDRCVSSSRGAT